MAFLFNLFATRKLQPYQEIQVGLYLVLNEVINEKSLAVIERSRQGSMKEVERLMGACIPFIVVGYSDMFPAAVNPISEQISKKAKSSLQGWL